MDRVSFRVRVDGRARRTRLSSKHGEATETEPALDDSSESEDTLAAMLATGT